MRASGFRSRCSGAEIYASRGGGLAEAACAGAEMDDCKARDEMMCGGWCWCHNLIIRSWGRLAGTSPLPLLLDGALCNTVDARERSGCQHARARSNVGDTVAMRKRWVWVGVEYLGR